MVTSYATAADYATWTGTTAPTNITQLLRSASLVITDATATAFYTVDTSGAPTDAVILQAFKDATCAQAAAMLTLGVDPLAGGTLTSGIASQKRIGTAHILYADGDAAAAAKSKALSGIVHEAALILEQAGIRLNSVWVSG